MDQLWVAHCDQQSLLRLLMRVLLYIAMFMLPEIVFSQAGIAALTDSTWSNLPSNERFHSAIQPAVRQAYNWIKTDSSSKGKNRRFSIGLNPEAFASYDTSFNYRAAIGFTAEYEGEKWYNRTSFASGWSTRERSNQTHPAYLPTHQHAGYLYNDIRTRFGYTPNEMLHVSFGIDNQFFGEGYRSLIQGDQVAPNPFAQMRVNFWRLEYGLMYQFLNELDSTDRIWKFNASHYLSWNATKNWNISFYETVLFQPSDGAYKRGFEVEYLNPIVFFRPQEYSVGSSDNVLLAFHSSYKIRQHKVYFQLSLDEFFLQEIRNRSKWWANKYGAQLGVKGHFKRFNYRVEGNLVRPYTYSHINYGQNVGNVGQPMGHTLGSNFAELLAMVDFNIKKFHVKTYAVFQLKGFDDASDSLNLSWGGNIYSNYLNRPKEYGNTIGQGITQRFLQVGGELSYTIQALRLQTYLQAGINYSWGEMATRFDPMLSIGFRTTLFVPRRLF